MIKRDYGLTKLHGKLSGKDAGEFWALVDVFAQPTLAAIERSQGDRE
jgi:hypothetical protein